MDDSGRGSQQAGFLGAQYSTSGYRPNSTSYAAAPEFSKTNLYIGGLHPKTRDEDLLKICQGYGPILSAKAMIDSVTDQCKGFGFVMFAQENHAKTAMDSLLKRGMQVVYAKPPKTHDDNQDALSQDPTNLYISALPHDYDEAKITQILQSFIQDIGAVVVSCRVLREPTTNNSRCVALARLNSPEACDYVIKNMRPDVLRVKLANGHAAKKPNRMMPLQPTDPFETFDPSLRTWSVPEFVPSAPIRIPQQQQQQQQSYQQQPQFAEFRPSNSVSHFASAFPSFMPPATPPTPSSTMTDLLRQTSYNSFSNIDLASLPSPSMSSVPISRNISDPWANNTSTTTPTDQNINTNMSLTSKRISSEPRPIGYGATRSISENVSHSWKDSTMQTEFQQQVSISHSWRESALRTLSNHSINQTWQDSIAPPQMQQQPLQQQSQFHLQFNPQWSTTTSKDATDLAFSAPTIASIPHSDWGLSASPKNFFLGPKSEDAPFKTSITSLPTASPVISPEINGNEFVIDALWDLGLE